MTGKDLLQAMNHLEDELVENGVQTTSSANITPLLRKTFKFAKPLKWVAAIVAAVVIFDCGMAYAAQHGIVRANPGWKSGYQLNITSRRVTEAEFSEEVRAVKKELLRDIAAAEDAEHTPAFGWIRDFDTIEETVDFIGHSELKCPAFPGDLEQTGVVVVGNNKADILYTDAFARYSYERVWASVSCRVYTDAFSYSTGAGIKEDGLQYADKVYVTANGKKAYLMIPDKYASNHGIQGHLVDGSVIYELRISGFGTDTDQLIQLMKNWLDQI